MSREIYINVEQHEKRVTVLDNKKIEEFYIERADTVNLVGNVYKGRVDSVFNHAAPRADGGKVSYGDLAGGGEPAGGLYAEMEEVLARLLRSRMNEKIGIEQIDILASTIAEATRHHPRIVRPGGVRGTLALREIAQAYGLLRGKVTRQTLADAALVALAHRNQVKPGKTMLLIKY